MLIIPCRVRCDAKEGCTEEVDAKLVRVLNEAIAAVFGVSRGEGLELPEGWTVSNFLTYCPKHAPLKRPKAAKAKEPSNG